MAKIPGRRPGRPRKEEPEKKRGRGRPAFRTSFELRDKVEKLISAGMKSREIAYALNISEPTLMKHFERELATGAAKKRAEAILLLWDSASDGNVAAQKKIIEMSSISAADAAMRALAAGEFEGGSGSGAPAMPPQKPAKLGKKEQVQQAADNVGGIYEVPAAPKLKLVSNNE